MNEQQIEAVKHIRNAVDDMFDKLNVELYDKKSAAKVSYTKVKPSDLITDNLEYIVQKLNLLQDEDE